jgi:hypothetical protein
MGYFSYEKEPLSIFTLKNNQQLLKTTENKPKTTNGNQDFDDCSKKHPHLCTIK